MSLKRSQEDSIALIISRMDSTSSLMRTDKEQGERCIRFDTSFPLF